MHGCQTPESQCASSQWHRIIASFSRGAGGKRNIDLGEPEMQRRQSAALTAGVNLILGPAGIPRSRAAGKPLLLQGPRLAAG